MKRSARLSQTVNHAKLELIMEECNQLEAVRELCMPACRKRKPLATNSIVTLAYLVAGIVGAYAVSAYAPAIELAPLLVVWHC